MPDDPFLGGLMFGMQMAERRRARKDEMEFEKQKFDSLMLLKKQEDDREAKQADMRLKADQQEFDQRAQLFGAQKQQTEQQVQAGAQKLQEEDTARKFGLLEMRARSRARRSLLERSQDPMAKEQLGILDEQDKLLEQEYRKASQPPAQAAPSPQPSGDSGQLGSDQAEGPPIETAATSPTPQQATQLTGTSGGTVPTQPSAQGGEGSAAWYRDIANAPAGSMKTTATGQTFRVYETDAEAKRAQKELDQMKESAGMPNYDPGYAIISKEAAQRQATQLEQQKMQEAVTNVELKQREEMARTVQNQPAAQLAFGRFRSPTQIQVNPATGQVEATNVDIRSIARDRSAFEQLQSEGKLTKPMLAAYNQAAAEALDRAKSVEIIGADGTKEKNPLDVALVDAGPGEQRINRIAVDDRVATVISQYRGLSEFLRANGERPAMEIREPTPAEVMQDYQAALPHDLLKRGPFKMADVGPFTIGGVTHTPIMVEQANSKLAAALARSIQENRDSPQLGQSINDAKNALASIRGQYAIGKAPEIESILNGGEKVASRNAAMPFTPQGPEPLTEKEQARRGVPNRWSGMGGEKGPAKGAGVGAWPGGFARMAGTMLALGGAQDVADANKAIGSITKASAKEKAQTIKDKSDEVKTAWAGASKEERKGILSSWTQARSKILANQKDFPVATLKLIDDIVGWKGK